MDDPIRALAHDHSELNRRVAAVRLSAADAFEGDSINGLLRQLGELRDSLFLHFAREEEALFPFVLDTASDLAAYVRAMEAAHDEICRALEQVIELATLGAPSSTIGPAFQQFEAIFVDHARVEANVLTLLETRLVGEQRAHLATLVRGI